MKRWLVDNFLPMWAKETVLFDNRRLMKENKRLKQKNKELLAYIRGVQDGLGSPLMIEPLSEADCDE